MTTGELLADLNRLGTRLEAHGERLRFYPRIAVTPDLLDRIKADTAGLLVMLRSDSDVLNLEAPPILAQPKCRCGSRHFVDVPSRREFPGSATLWR